MAGLKVVPVKSLADGSLDLEDLKAKAVKHKDNLAAFMVRLRSHPLPSFNDLRERLINHNFLFVDHIPINVRSV